MSERYRLTKLSLFILKCTFVHCSEFVAEYLTCCWFCKYTWRWNLRYYTCWSLWLLRWPHHSRHMTSTMSVSVAVTAREILGRCGTRSFKNSSRWGTRSLCWTRKSTTATMDRLRFPPYLRRQQVVSLKGCIASFSSFLVPILVTDLLCPSIIVIHHRFQACPTRSAYCVASNEVSRVDDSEPRQLFCFSRGEVVENFKSRWIVFILYEVVLVVSSNSPKGMLLRSAWHLMALAQCGPNIEKRRAWARAERCGFLSMRRSWRRVRRGRSGWNKWLCDCLFYCCLMFLNNLKLTAGKTIWITYMFNDNIHTS